MIKTFFLRGEKQKDKTKKKGQKDKKVSDTRELYREL
jgi:hypothetical protein